MFFSSKFWIELLTSKHCRVSCSMRQNYTTYSHSLNVQPCNKQLNWKKRTTEFCVPENAFGCFPHTFEGHGMGLNLMEQSEIDFNSNLSLTKEQTSTSYLISANDRSLFNHNINLNSFMPCKSAAISTRLSREYCIKFTNFSLYTATDTTWIYWTSRARFYKHQPGILAERIWNFLDLRNEKY